MLDFLPLTPYAQHEDDRFVMMIASHGALVAVSSDGRAARTWRVSRDQGVVYGVVSDGFSGVWMSERSMSVKEKDLLVHVAPDSAIARPLREGAGFVHDLVRSATRAYVADTKSGNVLAYAFDLNSDSEKHGLNPAKADFIIEGLFTGKDHLNTIAVDPYHEGRRLWVVLHGKTVRPSRAALIERAEDEDPSSSSIKFRIVRTAQAIGSQNHAWVAHRGAYLTLSSATSELVRVYADGSQRSLHRHPNGCFLKGLMVYDDVAYMGCSPPQRTVRERARVVSSVVVFDLLTLRVLRVREFTEDGAIGMINTLSVPHVSIDSPYRATSCARARAYREVLDVAQRKGWAFGYQAEPREAGFLRLPLRFDVEAMKREIEALVQRYGWTHRADVNNYFLLLITSEGKEDDQERVGPFNEVGTRLRDSPHLSRALASLRCVLGRARLMMIKPNEKVKPHTDSTPHYKWDATSTQYRADPRSGYWGRRFRVHLPIVSSPRVRFRVGETAEIHMRPEHAYVFDNSQTHSVRNDEPDLERIHLVVDTVGSVPFFELLSRGRFMASDDDHREVARELSSALPLGTTSRELIYERWRDAPVFEVMPQYFEHLEQVSSEIQDESQRSDYLELVRELRRASRAAEERRGGLREAAWDALISPLRCRHEAIGNLELGKTKEGSGGSGVRLVDYVEVLTRMAWYECEPGPVLAGQRRGPPCLGRRERGGAEALPRLAHPAWTF